MPSKQFIHYFDSDDYMSEECVQTCMEVVDKDTEVVLHNYYIFKDGTSPEVKGNIAIKYFANQLYKRFKDKEFSGDEAYKSVNKTQINFGWHGLISNAYLNKIALRFTPFLDMEDLNFGMILLAKASFIRALKEHLIGYRVREDSICNYQKNTNITVPDSLTYLSPYFKKGFEIRTYFNTYCHFFAALDSYLVLFKFKGLSKEALKSLESMLSLILKGRILLILDYHQKAKDPLNAFFIIKQLDFLKHDKILGINERLLLNMDTKKLKRYKPILIFIGLSIKASYHISYLMARFIYRSSGLKALRLKLHS
ncbi:hypothetical protein BKH43_08110 [Helicobacter sp. 13S00401-1]|nr:hypothetical protein BKH43_08110 [Helicobacter sp. 13S00401-1]